MEQTVDEILEVLLSKYDLSMLLSYVWIVCVVIKKITTDDLDISGS